MPVAAERVTVADTATEIIEADIDGASYAVSNRDADSVFLGGDDVTDTTGYELGAGESLGVRLDQGDVLYGVTASGTARVDVLRVGS